MRVNHFLTGEIGLLQKTGRAVISPAVYLGGKSSPCHRTKEANRVLSAGPKCEQMILACEEVGYKN